ncbi:MAG: alpha/beta hydrolase [Eubacteriales bacterium]|nr:alpha/beta hydrolase [Eubacteriales bacterium]
MRAVLQALSYGNIEVEGARRLADLKKLDPMRIFAKKLDAEVCNEDHEIPIRLYFPSEEVMKKGTGKGHTLPILLFFHGGGWVTESVENYDRVCAQMAKSTGQIVASVEYRLAPEYHFPIGLYDCYEAAKALYTNKFLLNTDPDQITIMGDSAGGNLAAAVCTMAKNKREFFPKRQILIYPALNNCYTEESPFPSVRENGEGYLLTSVKMEDYLNLYQSTQEDRENPYFAPILEKDLREMPDTLILTAEFDPLRDEGEAYGKKLQEAGNYVEVHRIKEALHGYFALGIKFFHVEESFQYINQFLRRGAELCQSQDIHNGEN